MERSFCGISTLCFAVLGTVDRPGSRTGIAAQARTAITPPVAVSFQTIKLADAPIVVLY
jgi:hypothetical protein